MSVSPISTPLQRPLAINEPLSSKKKFSLNWKECILIAATAIAVIAAVTAFFMNIPIFGTGFLILSLALGFATYQVRKYSQYEKAQELTNSLSDIHDNFQETEKKLRRTREELGETVTALRHEVVHFQEENLQLRTTAETLETGVADLRSENQNLRTQIGRLNALIQNGGALLIEQWKEFRLIQHNVAKENKQLIKIVKSLRQTEEKLAKTTADLEQANNKHLRITATYMAMVQQMLPSNSGSSSSPPLGITSSETDD